MYTGRDNMTHLYRETNISLYLMIRFSSSLKTHSLNSFNTNSYFNNTPIQGERVNATIIQGNLNGTVIQGDNDPIQRETNQVCIRDKLTRPVYKKN